MILFIPLFLIGIVVSYDLYTRFTLTDDKMRTLFEYIKRIDEQMVNYFDYANCLEEEIKTLKGILVEKKKKKAHEKSNS